MSWRSYSLIRLPKACSTYPKNRYLGKSFHPNFLAGKTSVLLYESLQTDQIYTKRQNQIHLAGSSSVTVDFTITPISDNEWPSCLSSSLPSTGIYDRPRCPHSRTTGCDWANHAWGGTRDQKPSGRNTRLAQLLPQNYLIQVSMNTPRSSSRKPID